MKKTLVYSVPDELWVNSFEKKITKSFTYDGPSSFWIIVNNDNIVVSYNTEEPDITEYQSKYFIDLETGTDDELALAILLVHRSDTHEYSYLDETNHDNSVYQCISNPRLQDYYYPTYIGGKVFLNLIIKDPLNPNESIAKERKEYVEKYIHAFEFDTETKGIIDAYISNINEYLKLMETAYPWKYIQMDKNEIPKIPVSLITIFNSLPELN